MQQKCLNNANELVCRTRLFSDQVLEEETVSEEIEIIRQGVGEMGERFNSVVDW